MGSGLFMNISKSKIGLIVGMLAVVIFGGILLKKNSAKTPAEKPPRFIDEVLAEMGVNAFADQKFWVYAQTKVGGGKTSLIEAFQQQRLLKVRLTKGLDERGITAEVDFHKSAIADLFKVGQNPYTERTTEKRCPAELLPKVTKVKNYQMLSLYAGNRFEAGACRLREVVYKGYIFFLQNVDSTELMQIEFYIPYQESAEAVEKLVATLPSHFKPIELKNWSID